MGRSQVKYNQKHGRPGNKGGRGGGRGKEASLTGGADIRNNSSNSGSGRYHENNNKWRGIGSANRQEQFEEGDYHDDAEEEEEEGDENGENINNTKHFLTSEVYDRNVVMSGATYSLNDGINVGSDENNNFVELSSILISNLYPDINLMSQTLSKMKLSERLKLPSYLIDDDDDDESTTFTFNNKNDASPCSTTQQKHHQAISTMKIHESEEQQEAETSRNIITPTCDDDDDDDENGNLENRHGNDNTVEDDDNDDDDDDMEAWLDDMIS